jgi:proline dehydrogenase
VVCLEDQNNNIIKKLVFRLVKRHIAGSTSESVLNAVKDLNNRGFHATVTLLNDHVDDPTKAKYNANAYIQSIRQLTRLNLNSDVSIRLSQLGAGMDKEMLERNLKSVVDVAEACKQRIWIEHEKELKPNESFAIYRKFKDKCSYLGFEYYLNGNNKQLTLVKGKDNIKLMAHDRNYRLRHASKKSEGLDIYKDHIDALIGKKVNLTIIEDDPGLIGKIIGINKDYKRNLIFEVPFGYGIKKLSTLQKNRLNLSVYVPYGKDWIPYFINSLADGRLRNIAVALLNGEKSNVG